MTKSLFTISFAVLVLASCGNNTQTSTAATDEKKAGTESPANMSPEEQKGLDLVAKNDCFTCHKINETLVGPAYSAVAAKYQPTQQNIDSLSSKIIHGGSGNWGTAAMTPHPNLSKEDAQSMVKYVLSLKNQ